MISEGGAEFNDAELKVLPQKPFAVQKLLHVLSDVLAE
jgi:hypothetical protein